MARVEVDIAEKRFGEPLFSGFALDVAPGEVVALLGPSGIGKSTLLRMVASIDHDFAGTISIDGVPAHMAPAPGFVFQDARLLPWLTVRENVALAGGNAEALLAQVGLAGRGRDYPHQLSGGMARRGALARALATETNLLLLDEPFVSLDAALALEMSTLLAQVIRARLPTVILVTHVRAEAELLADRIVTLEGRPARIVDDRRNEKRPVSF